MRLVGRTRRQFCILACRLEKAKSFQVTDSAFFVVDFDGGGGGGGGGYKRHETNKKTGTLLDIPSARMVTHTHITQW